MDTLEIAYKILYSLEHKEKADYMGTVVGPEKLGVPPEKWLAVMELLLEEGYISGARIFTDILGETHVDIKKCRITMKGAEYLRENSTMRKFAKVASDVISVVKP